jgi:acyl-CoA hydrolase
VQTSNYMTQNVESLDDISGFLSDASEIYVSGCAAEIEGLDRVAGLIERNTPATISGIFLPGINRVDYSALSPKLRCQSYFMTPQLKQGVPQGRVDYCPWRYRDILAFYQRCPVDVAVLMISEPDSKGYCSYGVCADYAPIVMPQARVKIGVINRQMPYTQGCKGIHIDQLDCVVSIDQPLKSVPRQSPDEVSRAIAKTVGRYIDDGCILQMGLGKVPSAVAEELADRRELKIVSGLLDESSLILEQAGALSAEQAAIGGVALGTEAFYRAIDNNPRFSFQPVSVTHDFNRLSAIDNFVAINGALEVDLLGQVNSSVIAGGHFSGPGGLPEFVNAALASRGGRSIIVLPATGRANETKIVANLTGGIPSVAAVDADIVISEYGAAELRGKSIRQRMAAMITIAAPEHRDQLNQQTKILY